MTTTPPAIPNHTLLRVIGRGSYGEVWLARAEATGTLRAVKIIRRDSASGRGYEREFAGLMRFEPLSRAYEGLVDILHIGRDDAAGFYFYVMELADDARGSAQCSVLSAQSAEPDTEHFLLSTEHYAPRTLSAVIARDARLPFHECLRVARALAGALAHLHSHGLVHRDVKPSNIIFVGGVPKLADIGLVAEAGGAQSFVGTEGYVPREGPGSPRADIFAMGKVIFESLTGAEARQFPELPDDWLTLPDLADRAELNEIVLRCCEDDAAQRYQRVEDVLAHLELLAGGKSVRRLRALERRVRWLGYGGIAAGVLLALTFGGVAIFRRQAENERNLRALADDARADALLAQARAARRDIAPGAVTAALAALRDAAKIHPSLAARNEAVFFLGRADLVPSPEFSIANKPSQLVLLSPNGREHLHVARSFEQLQQSTRRAKAELRAGQNSRALEGDLLPRGAVLDSFEFSAGGTFLLARGGGAGRVFDTRTGRALAEIADFDFRDAHFLGDDRIVQWLAPGGYRVADLAKGALIPDIAAPASPGGNVLHPSPTGDGLLHVRAADNSFHFVELPSGKTRWSHPPAHGAGFLAWAPDGGACAIHFPDADKPDAARIRVFAASDGRELRMTASHNSSGIIAAFIGGRHVLAVGNWSGATWLHDTLADEPLIRLPHAGAIASGPRGDGALMMLHGWSSSGGSIGKAFVWQPSRVLRVFRRKADASTGPVTFSPDERWLITAHDAAFCWWRLDPADDSAPRFTHPHEFAQASFFSPDGAQWTSVCERGPSTMPYADAPDAPRIGKRIEVGWKFPGPLAGGVQPNRVARSRDGTLCAVAGNGAIAVWRNGGAEKDSALVAQFTIGGGGSATSAALSPDNRWLAAGSFFGGATLVWDLTKPAAPAHSEKVATGCDVAFSPDGRWLAIAGDDANIILETGTWRVAQRWPREASSQPGSCAFSPDGRWLALNDARDELVVRDTAAWTEMFRLRSPHGGRLDFPEFSASSRHLAARGSRGEYYAWDLRALDAELRAMGLGW